MVTNTVSISRLRWVFISGAAFILFFILSIVLILFADRISSLGITKSFYFIILVPVGLCAAAFLFGALRSHAKYTGKGSYGQLELTGPVVIFCLVIIGGFYFAEPESSFLLTVRVHKAGDISKTVKNGSVILDLGEQRLKRNIGENGEVLFAGISTLYLSKEIHIFPDIEGYRAVNKSSYKVPGNHVVFLEVIPGQDSTLVRGTVIDREGNQLPDVLLDFESGLIQSRSDEIGNFKVNLPLAAGSPVLVTAYYNNKIGFRDYITIPEKTPLTIKLTGIP